MLRKETFFRPTDSLVGIHVGVAHDQVLVR